MLALLLKTLLIIARRLKLNIESGPNVILMCFMGNKLNANLITKMHITIEEVSAVVKALVIGDAYLNYDMIVGVDFLG